VNAGTTVLADGQPEQWAAGSIEPECPGDGQFTNFAQGTTQSASARHHGKQRHGATDQLTANISLGGGAPVGFEDGHRNHRRRSGVAGERIYVTRHTGPADGEPNSGNTPAEPEYSGDEPVHDFAQARHNSVLERGSRQHRNRGQCHQPDPRTFRLRATPPLSGRTLTVTTGAEVVGPLANAFAVARHTRAADPKPEHRGNRGNRT